MQWHSSGKHPTNRVPAIESQQKSPAKEYCLNMMTLLRRYRSLNFELLSGRYDPVLSTDVLFGENRGQMFGALICETPEKTILALRAFSGQYNGVWVTNGWVPPVLNQEVFSEAVKRTDPEIKRLTAEINGNQGSRVKELIARRRELSRTHMAEIHKMYRIRNFKGEESDLCSIFGTADSKACSIPAGTGDCCAPKLLNTAIERGLKPLSMAEFFWGRTNRSGSKLHGHFYPPCTEKCIPLLGFMLRGTGLRLSPAGDSLES